MFVGNRSLFAEEPRRSAYESNPRPPERVIAKHGAHKLVVSRFHGNCFDLHGRDRFYLFRYETEASAIARWKGWLRSMGED